MTITIPDSIDKGLLLRWHHGALMPGSSEEWRAEEQFIDLLGCLPDEDNCESTSVN